MLALSTTVSPPTSMGRAMRRRRRSATARAVASSSTSASSTANSSALNRARVSLGSRDFGRRRAMVTSSWSPIEWPRLSFATLKRSTSITIRAPRGRLARAAWLRSMRSNNSVRLGSPVRVSWVALWMTRCSASLRAVTSDSEAPMRVGEPSGRRTAMPRLITQRQPPSPWWMRYSLSKCAVSPARCASMSALTRAKSSAWMRLNHSSGVGRSSSQSHSPSLAPRAASA